MANFRRGLSLHPGVADMQCKGLVLQKLQTRMTIMTGQQDSDELSIHSITVIRGKLSCYCGTV